MNEITNIVEKPTLLKQDIELSKLIYTIRGKQIMLDCDLAILYGYTVKRLNEQVKNNKNRFPEDFMFQMTREEVNDLRSKFPTANINPKSRYLPQMRHFISSNALLFERINAVELKQLELQKDAEENFTKIFEYISNHEEECQKIFFDGQIFDAFSLLTNIITHAQKEIILIDGYIDIITLNILAKKNIGVNVYTYTLPNTKLSAQDIANFNAQYPTLTVKKTASFHDRFLIIDGKEGYHIGASLKDAGKKCFGINRIEGVEDIKDIITKAQQTGK